MGDAEYMAAFQRIVMPIAYEVGFFPTLSFILVKYKCLVFTHFCSFSESDENVNVLNFFQVL